MTEDQPGGPDGRGPLAGITVIDFTRVLAGPLATMNLADLGASVIKIERPGAGDDTRAWGPPWVGSDSTYYLGINRNKQSVALDLNSERDLGIAAELCATADVVAENFRPGYMTERGLGPTKLRESNPALVYLSIEAFTGSGPAAALPGYDLIGDPRFADGSSRRANVDELVAEITSVLVTDTKEAWLENLLAAGVPAGAINSIAEAVAWAESMGLTPTVTDQQRDYRAVRSPIRIDGHVQSTCTAPPNLDQHGAEIRAAHDRRQS